MSGEGCIPAGRTMAKQGKGAKNGKKAKKKGQVDVAAVKPGTPAPPPPGSGTGAADLLPIEGPARAMV
ncbi:MAG TPA: hypothetical protein PKA49_16120, partial [Tepidiformaceae bacterium]|nr:hypothetical protein [Tepidiformaceae bacterium]